MGRHRLGVGVIRVERSWDVQEGFVALKTAKGRRRVPIAGVLRDYLIEHKEAIEAGTHDELPTSGFWRWQTVNEHVIGDWMYVHRSQLWSMFYGSMPVPRR